jgi:hypothetical protein
MPEGSKTVSERPNPGSDEAYAQGCTCPRLDNNCGEGMPYDLTTLFYICADCPLHAKGKDRE